MWLLRNTSRPERLPHKAMMPRLLGALQFLTIVPVRSGATPADSAVFFPLVGALLGACAAAVFQLPLPASLAALLAVLFLVAITGGLHEDGLADVFDAFRAGRPPERIHAILKDSRIGTYGALALILAILLRWQTIALLSGRALPALAAAAGASRAAMVVLAYIAKPAGEGLGRDFHKGLRPAAVTAAALQGVLLPWVCGPMAGCAALAANVLIVLLARAYFERRIGGVTGDCLGAACQVSEIALLLILCSI